MEDIISNTDIPQWVIELFNLMDSNPVKSDGITWTREELYQR